MAARRAPTAPAGLHADALTRWRQIWASDVARTWDRDAVVGAVSRYIQNFDLWLRYRASVAEARMIRVGGTTDARGAPSGGRLAPNPLAMRMEAIERELRAFEADYGLSPVSASRLGVEPSGGPAEKVGTLDDVLKAMSADLQQQWAETGEHAARRELSRVRAMRALQMRLGGASSREIALALGLSRNGAWKAIQRGLREQYEEPTRERVSLAVQRLEKLIQAAWPAAMAGDVKAIREVREIQVALNRLLGLEAPQKMELTWAEIERDTRDRAKAMGLNPDESEQAVAFVRSHLGV